MTKRGADCIMPNVRISKNPVEMEIFPIVLPYVNEQVQRMNEKRGTILSEKLLG